MALFQFNLDVWVLPSVSDAKDLAGASIDLSNYNDSTYQWQNNDTLQDGNPVSENAIWDTDLLSDFAADDTFQPLADEGVLVGGSVVQVATLAASPSTVVTMTDGTEFTVNGRIYILEDGTTLIQVIDNDIDTILAAGYQRYNIADITLGPDVNYMISVNPGNLDNVFVCFAAGTLIETSEGLAAVETLRQGDLVRTKDQGVQPILWIGKRRITLAEHPATENLRPVCIKEGALGQGIPARDLIVSQQHRILISSKVAERMFGEKDVLVQAKKLLDCEGISIMHDLAHVTYVHFLFDRHQIVYSNGAETESLFTGPEALKAVSPEQRAEILEIFPELMDRIAPPSPVRKIARGRKVAKLVKRTQKNNHPMICI